MISSFHQSPKAFILSFIKATVDFFDLIYDRFLTPKTR